MTLEHDIAEPIRQRADADTQEDARALKAKVDYMLTCYETTVVDAAIDGVMIDMALFNSLRNQFSKDIAAWKNEGGAR
jgi:hypothetical protein